MSASRVAREGAYVLRNTGPRAAASSRGVIAQKSFEESRSKPNPARITSSHGKGLCEGSDSTAALKGLTWNRFLAFQRFRMWQSEVLKRYMRTRLHRLRLAFRQHRHSSHYDRHRAGPRK